MSMWDSLRGRHTIGVQAVVAMVVIERASPENFSVNIV